ncbi:run domain Beclin-1-interacting and cysteine-rich domain-containing protein isoform X1 [Lucilia cuprina]|uniref:run domain Beclin-1-interacting and cysteine-rich domain-containing protein isoform X1 n=1 Tax=Lucilia cuprina TaxID=7375 RepID=UPI001F05C5EA|nr:run domain Beclin-1-interacting and cysteine-rich domain-containing protein isoform X1 [Lucilia cuprina]
MATKVKEKLQLLPKDEIKCRELIENLKKTLNLWFLYGAVDDTILKEVLNSCAEIILHGLKNQPEKLQTNTSINALDYDSSPTTSAASMNVNTNNNNNNNIDNNNGNNDLNLNVLHKIIDDFEWVRNAVSIRRNSNNTPPRRILTPTLGGAKASLLLQNRQIQLNVNRKETPRETTILTHVTRWLMHNLNEHNLCGFLQYLVTDKELLEEHYSEEALLRQEKYCTILVIGLTAFETHQYGLLSQIDAVLKDDIKDNKIHKRSNSQPNVIIVPQTKRKVSSVKNSPTKTSTQLHPSSTCLLTIRKTKSLPELTKQMLTSPDDTDAGYLKRPRRKTIGTIRSRITKPQNIPQNVNTNINASHTTTSSSGSFLLDYDDNQPTTSQASSNRSKSPISNYTLNSNKSNTSSLMSTSVSSCNSNSTTKCIQLINTDDIKIWTDHTWEMKQKNKQQNQHPTASCAIPTPLATNTKPSKSLSPLNSFFSSLFSTPPSYTSWFVDHGGRTEQESTETAIESIIPDNQQQHHHSVMSSQQQLSSLSLGSTVFDKFLPIDGKKLKSRKSQSLFEDVNTTLDCSGINMLVSADSPTTTSSPGSALVTPKNCQSLTRFLQMSHLSRNNTELEKENAHFRISEAIISAIEHIKWNKLETQKDKELREATPLATDYLAASDVTQNFNVPTSSSDIIEGEHIPYAELEEVSYDLLSAEVVGLSLISKFDEKHLPKVSELKWLVSDDDTPQKLLPMPDLTSSANPDEHVIHSATRGTRYWAPPRQQIIFTDHPTPNRKELLKKQNYRCAGCGMRVSPQYMQSFRYCTYLGKYHCTGCHRNQISATPAKILQAWDFKCYPVSVFAYRLLEQMYAYPLFYVPDLNPALYIRSKSLLSARNKRLQLKFVKDFIRMCRFALREQSYFESVPDYITADIDNWSMSDFIDAHTKCLHRSIDELISKCENHIFNCVLCTARGFLCEYCHADVIIYPWDSRVERCDRCGTCFHRSCWKSLSEKCCRCQRIDKRQDEINDVI